MPKLVVMLRVKDGIFFVHEWLNCFEKIADEIVVLDNGSTDGTYEILKAHKKVVTVRRTKGYNEGRDKNLLYNDARKCRPDWCLWVDVDEVFESGLQRKDFDKLMKRSFINKYGFRRFHFIDRENFAGSWFRLNYTSGHDRIMWRESAEGYFENIIIDSPNVLGIKGILWRTNFRLKHLGYINKDIVDKKAGIYRAIIPGKEKIFQEMYMQNERKIKWNDDRKSAEVFLMNSMLNCILLTHLYYKAKAKLTNLFKQRNTEQASISANSLNEIKDKNKAISYLN